MTMMHQPLPLLPYPNLITIPSPTTTTKPTTTSQPNHNPDPTSISTSSTSKRIKERYYANVKLDPDPKHSHNIIILSQLIYGFFASVDAVRDSILDTIHYIRSGIVGRIRGVIQLILDIARHRPVDPSLSFMTTSPHINNSTTPLPTTILFNKSTPTQPPSLLDSIPHPTTLLDHSIDVESIISTTTPSSQLTLQQLNSSTTTNHFPHHLDTTNATTTAISSVLDNPYYNSHLFWDYQGSANSGIAQSQAGIGGMNGGLGGLPTQFSPIATLFGPNPQNEPFSHRLYTTGYSLLTLLRNLCNDTLAMIGTTPRQRYRLSLSLHLITKWLVKIITKIITIIKTIYHGSIILPILIRFIITRIRRMIGVVGGVMWWLVEDYGVVVLWSFTLATIFFHHCVHLQYSGFTPRCYDDFDWPSSGVDVVGGGLSSSSLSSSLPSPQQQQQQSQSSSSYTAHHLIGSSKHDHFATTTHYNDYNNNNNDHGGGTQPSTTTTTTTPTHPALATPTSTIIPTITNFITANGVIPRHLLIELHHNMTEFNALLIDCLKVVLFHSGMY